MKLTLTEEMKQHLPSILWLFEDTEGPVGTRQTGRSTLLAYVFMQLAKKNPGKIIPVVDHTRSKAATKYLLRKIKQFAAGDPELLAVNEWRKLHIDEQGCFIVMEE